MRKLILFVCAFVLVGGLWYMASRDIEFDATESELDQASEGSELSDIEPNLSASSNSNASEPTGKSQRDSSPPEETSTPYIVDCSSDSLFGADENEKLDADPRELEEESRRERARLSEYLKSKPGVESELVAAMLLDDIDRLALLNAVLERQPQNGIAWLMYLRNCASECDPQLEVNAIRAVGGNGNIWYQIANNRISRQDEEGALKAIQQAASASQFDEYFTGRLDLISRVIPSEYVRHSAANSAFPSGVEIDRLSDNAFSFLYGFSVVFAQDLFTQENVKGFCTKDSEQRADIAQACFQLGVQMAENGETIGTNHNGYTLQKHYYESLGDSEGIAEVEAAQDRILNYPEDLFFKSLAVAFYDDRLMDVWRLQASAYGEADASNALVDEAIRLSSDPNYNPCP